MTAPRRRAHRTLRRVLVPLAVAVAGLLITPGTAQAHPTLLYTTPAADTAEPTTPASLILVFTEPVTPAPTGLVVIDQTGQQTPAQQVATARGGTVVTGQLPNSLPSGVYTVRWRVTGADGDLVESTFRFAVGAALTPADPASTAGAGTSWPPAAWRWLLFAGLALALGGAAGSRLSDSARSLRPNLPPLSRWQPAGAVAGLAGAAGLAISLAATSGLGVVTSTTPGRVALVEATAFAACLALLRALPAWAWLPLLAVPVAEGLRGHVQQAQPGWGALLIAVHLAAVAVWIGALTHVVHTAMVWRAHRPAVWWVVTGYARWAGWLFAAVLATGTLSAMLVMPVSALTTTTYGRWLLTKLTLVAVAVAAAASARWWLHRGEHTLPRVAAATRTEAASLAAVLAVTAVLVSTPPATQGAPLAPPAPKGTVVPLATLAGQIGVAVAASDGQLVVRLATPNRGDYYTPNTDEQSFTLTGRLAPAGQPERALRWRPCGNGCFSATADWRDGDNLLTMRATAKDWRGGTATLLVPWPVQPGTDELARAVTAVKAAGPITVYETITSDTSTPMPEPTPLHLTGAQFIATEPYSSGTAAQTVILHRNAGTMRLAVGYPAEGRYAELVLDSRNRIVQEILVDAKHLTRRSLIYPDATSG